MDWLIRQESLEVSGSVGVDAGVDVGGCVGVGDFHSEGCSVIDLSVCVESVC